MNKQNGKGKEPEKGRDLKKFREGWDGINWETKKKNSNNNKKP